MTKNVGIEAIEAYLREAAKRKTLTESLGTCETIHDLTGGDLDEAYDTGIGDGGVWECRHILKTFFDAEGE